jgi:hypothetical protein
VVSSAYEAWVEAIYAWRENPRHDLTQLPTLLVESLPPTAFDRLFTHIAKAQQHVMDRWSETFIRDWASARDEYAAVRVLMASRVVMARRLQLAGHPGLPEEVRQEFTEGVARDVRKLQQDLEVIATRQSGHRIDRTATERTLNLLRANRLTAILEPGFPLQALIEGRLDAPPPPPVPSPAAAADPRAADDQSPPARRKYRAIIIDS